MSDSNGKSLVFGDLELIDPNRTSNPDLDVAVQVMAEGTTWGNPQPIEVAIRSLIQLGTNMVTQGWDNRDGTAVRVKFTATDLDKVAAAEERLMAQVGKRNKMTWTPPDGIGAPTVFVIVTSSFDYLPNDVAEVQYPPSAQYSIRLIPEPFVRSDFTIRTPALPPAGTTQTVVDDCSSTTGWSSSVPVTDIGSEIRVSRPSFSSARVYATRIGTIDFADLPYIAVDWRATVNDPPFPEVDRPGYLLATIGAQPLVLVYRGREGNGFRSVFEVPADMDSADEITLELQPAEYTSSPLHLSLDVLAVTDARGPAGTGREQQRVIPVEGAAPSDATLIIEHPTAGLGDVLAYVYPDDYPDYEPALDAFRVAGPDPTADATTVSGQWYSLFPASEYLSPAAAYPPGSYALLARVRVPSIGGFIDYTAQIQTPVPQGTAQAGRFQIAETDDWVIVTIAELQLPDWQLGRTTTADVAVTLQGLGVEVDRVWLFNIDIGYLSQVACDAGTATDEGPFNRLWFEPATVESSIPKVLRGHAADQSDAHHPGDDLESWMPAYFDPPAVNVLVVSTGAVTPSVALEHTPAWHTRARRVQGQ